MDVIYRHGNKLEYLRFDLNKFEEDVLYDDDNDNVEKRMSHQATNTTQQQTHNTAPTTSSLHHLGTSIDHPQHFMLFFMAHCNTLKILQLQIDTPLDINWGGECVHSDLYISMLVRNGL